jgi:hypothetical protein
MRSHTLGFLTLTLLLTVLPAVATQIYFNDFTNGAGSEWSYTTLSGGSSAPKGVNQTTSGNKFLGQFSDQIVSLTFANRPAAQITVEFDLFIISNWDGNTGPDTWTLQAAGGPTLLNTTFSNTSNAQAYPNGGNNAQGTGAVAYYGSGIVNPSGVNDEYSLYHLTYSFYFAGGDLVLQFSSDVNSPTQETFALDNVSVHNDAVPEPATSFLLVLGLIGLAICRKSFSLEPAERSMA